MTTTFTSKIRDQYQIGTCQTNSKPPISCIDDIKHIGMAVQLVIEHICKVLLLFESSYCFQSCVCLWVMWQNGTASNTVQPLQFSEKYNKYKNNYSLSCTSPFLGWAGSVFFSFFFQPQNQLVIVEYWRCFDRFSELNPNWECKDKCCRYATTGRNSY